MESRTGCTRPLDSLSHAGGLPAGHSALTYRARLAPKPLVAISAQSESAPDQRQSGGEMVVASRATTSGSARATLGRVWARPLGHSIH